MIGYGNSPGGSRGIGMLGESSEKNRTPPCTVSEVRPRTCVKIHESVRQDMRTQSYRIHFRQIDANMKSTWSVSDTFAEIYGFQGAPAAKTSDGELPHRTIYSPILRKSSRAAEFSATAAPGGVGAATPHRKQKKRRSEVRNGAAGMHRGGCVTIRRRCLPRYARRDFSNRGRFWRPRGPFPR